MSKYRPTSRKSSNQHATTQAASVRSRALTLYANGRIMESLSAAKQCLLTFKEDVDLLSLLAHCHMQLGNYDDAIDFFKMALAVDPYNADNHNNMGVIFQRTKRFAESEDSYRIALRINPEYINACYNLGSLLLEQGQFEEAETHLQHVLQINAQHADACCKLGKIYHKRLRFKESEEYYNHALRLYPMHAEALFSLRELQSDLKIFHYKELELSTRQALLARPGNIDTICHLAHLLRELKKYEESESFFKEALRINPNNADVQYKIGLLYQTLERFDEAEKHLKEAIHIKNDYAEPHLYLGLIFNTLKRYDESEYYYQNAVRINPDFADAHYYLATLQLFLGNLQEGLRNYEWRWLIDGFRSVRFNNYYSYLWNGEPVKGKRLLIWDEQGIGENLLFASMYPELQAQGARLTIECDERLIPIFSRSFPGISCIANNDANSFARRDSYVDYHAIACRLASKFRPGLPEIRHRPFYLKADSAKRNLLRNRYLKGNSKDMLLVGISWNSKRSFHYHTRKSVDLMQLRPVLETKGIVLVDLQYGETSTERFEFQKQTGISILHDDSVDQMTGLDLFAAQVAAMDLVVTISNTTAHMAGALGIPTLLILGDTPIWYWGATGDKSSWYPSLQLFRAKNRGEWTEVIQNVAQELNERIQRR
ncbi:MAG: tetratricopeptide repeat protein [Magnetococcus sp. YQC-3]